MNICSERMAQNDLRPGEAHWWRIGDLMPSVLARLGVNAPQDNRGSPDTNKSPLQVGQEPAKGKTAKASLSHGSFCP